MGTGTVGNWVGETTTTVGTGAITLSGPLQGFTSFSSIGDNQFWYAIADGNNREAGMGTLSGNTLTRSTVYSTLTNGVYADNSPGPISLSGLAQVFSTFNKTAFDELDDGVDASNVHISNGEIHISGPGTTVGDTIAWDGSAWGPVGSAGATVEPGQAPGETLRWNGTSYENQGFLTIKDTGEVGVGSSDPQNPLDVNGKTRTATLETLGQAGIGTATPHASSMLDVNGAIYTESIPLINGAKRIEVRASLPGTQDPNTIYMLTGP